MSDSIFNLMFFIGPIFFLIIAGFIIFTICRGIKEWSHNNKQPIVPVESKVVAKRTNVTGGVDQNSSAHTTYYVTFQFINNERKEFLVAGNVYGLISEGDEGTLSFQGTRFIDFKRYI